MNINQYLASSHYIDWRHPELLEKATSLAYETENNEQIAKACFLFVRDEIKHSWDFELININV